MIKSSSAAALYVAALFGSTSAQAATVFSDNFDTGIVSGWTEMTYTTGNSAVMAGIGWNGTDSLYTLFDANNGVGGGTGLIVRAIHSFNATTPGDYQLSLSAWNASCQGCTEFYEILVDGAVLAHTSSPSA